MNEQTLNRSSEQAILEKAISENTFNDALYLLEQGPSIRMLAACEIISRHVNKWARHNIELDVLNAWELEEPELVVRAIQLAAHENSTTALRSPMELRKAVLETLLPALDIFFQMTLLESMSESAN